MRQQFEASAVEAALYAAGRTLMALPARGCRPAGFRCSMPDILPQALAAEFGADYLLRAEPSRSRVPVPPPAAISAMDQALSWIGLLPGATDLEVKTRQLVWARCLVSPRTDRNLYSWKQLGEMLGCSDKTAKTRWIDAVAVITARLNQPGFCTASGGKVGPAPDRIMWTRRPARISSAAAAELVGT